MDPMQLKTYSGWFNSLWPSDGIGWYTFGAKLVQVMVILPDGTMTRIFPFSHSQCCRSPGYARSIHGIEPLRPEYSTLSSISLNSHQCNRPIHIILILHVLTSCLYHHAQTVINYSVSMLHPIVVYVHYCWCSAVFDEAYRDIYFSLSHWTLGDMVLILSV